MLLPATPGWVSLPVVVGGPRHSWLGSVGGVAVWCVVCGGGVLAGLWSVCGVVGPSPLLAVVPVCYSPPILAGFRCRWWWAVPATPGWGPLAAVVCGVRCVAVVCWWGCGWCVVWLVPRHSWRWFLCATPRHSWLGFAAGGGGRSPPLLAGVRWRRWCVVCGVWRWCVGGVVAGVWCGWSPATPGGGSCVLLPATPGWVSLLVVVGGPRHSWLGSACGGGVWCVVCVVWRWCVGGAVAGVWCGWSLATPGGGSCVLPPATPGWVSLPVVVGGPRHSWLGTVGGVAVWCVVCGGGVLVGLWLVCGVVGPSPLLAVVPVCSSPPLLAGFCCRWWWAVPATPGWGPLAAVVCGVWCVVCGVWRWCVGGVVAGVWCGWSLATPGGGSCVLLPANPGWVSLPLVVGGPRHSWLGSAGGGGVWCVVCGVWRWCVVGVVVGVWCGWSLATPGGGPFLLLPATPGWVSLPVVVGSPHHSWLGSVGGGGVWCVVCGVLVGSLATPGGGSCVLLPATPGWVSLPLVVGGPRHLWLGSAGGGGVWCVVCGSGVLVGLWLGAHSSFRTAAGVRVCSCACFAWPGRASRPPGRVLVRLTFSFGRFVFLLGLAPSGLRLPLSLSLLLPFLVGCFSRPPAAWLSVRSRLVCVSRLAVGCSLVVAPPPPSPFVSRGFRRSCLVPWCFFFVCFFFFLLLLPPCAPVVSGFLWFPAPGALGLGACVVCFVGLPLLGSPCACPPFVLSAWLLAAPAWLPPPPPLCVSRFSFLPLGAVCCVVLCVPGCGAAPRCCALCRPVLCCRVLCCARLVPLLVAPCPLALPVALGPCALRRGVLRCSPALCALCCVCFVLARWCVVLFAALPCAVCVSGCSAVRSLCSPFCAVLCFAVLVRPRCAVRVVRAVAGAWCCGALLCVVLFPVVCRGAVLGLVAHGCLLVACFGVGVPVWPCGLLPCGWCGLLWCPAFLCRVLWCCAVAWCFAVVLCCRVAVLLGLALPPCGLSCCAVLCCFFGAWGLPPGEHNTKAA